MKREVGFYWVRMTDSLDWEPARWNSGGYWTIFEGIGAPISDAEMVEICEIKMSRDEKYPVQRMKDVYNELCATINKHMHAFGEINMGYLDIKVPMCIFRASVHNLGVDLKDLTDFEA